MKRRRMKAFGGAACLAALGAVAVIALPASGTAVPGSSAFFATLHGVHEAPDADPDGYGSFSAGFNGTKLCFGLQVFKIGTPNAAHIHQAPVGSNGPIKVTLNVPASGTAGASAGCKDLSATPALVNAIKSTPGAFYVNVHNTTFPGGAIRGQLFRATASQDK
jgi:hypothetical protein